MQRENQNAGWRCIDYQGFALLAAATTTTTLISGDYMKPFEDDGNTSRVVVSMNVLQQQPVKVGQVLALNPRSMYWFVVRKPLRIPVFVGLALKRPDTSRVSKSYQSFPV